MKTRNIFISHSWSRNKHYKGVKRLLDSTTLPYRDFSIPKDDPIHNARNSSELKKGIERQIKPCSCVVIPAGVHASRSKWIGEEINISKRLGKPIIAVKPRGAKRTSDLVEDAADETVRWNSKSIASAIKRRS